MGTLCLENHHQSFFLAADLLLVSLLHPAADVENILTTALKLIASQSFCALFLLQNDYYISTSWPQS